MRKPLSLLAGLAFAVLLAGAAQGAPDCSTVSISGPSNVYAETGCVNPAWSAVCSCSNGARPQYVWVIDGAYAGSASSATRQFCPQSPPDAYTMSVNVTITCGHTSYYKQKSVFVSLCDNSSWPPLCLG